MTYSVAAFYKFVTIDDGAQLREHLAATCAKLDIIGLVLIAPEGINGTLAGSQGNIGALLSDLSTDRRFQGLDVKHSVSSTRPFKRLKVKLKREIVTFGVPSANPAVRVGTYVDAADWNAIISDPETVVIDTRNDYEIDVGTFKGARDPKTTSFGQFPDFVKANLDPARHKKIAMFCTGGIRCEKASALMLTLGFEDVYHLKGGILKYLETVPPEHSLWQGECFVFDERIAVTHGVTEGITRLCPVCDDAMRDGRTCPKCAAIGTDGF